MMLVDKIQKIAGNFSGVEGPMKFFINLGGTGWGSAEKPPTFVSNLVTVFFQSSGGHVLGVGVGVLDKG